MEAGAPQAHRLPGAVFAWGRQNRGRERSLNPVNSFHRSALLAPAMLLLPKQIRCQEHKGFSCSALSCAL